MLEADPSRYIDDLPPMMFMKNSANSHGWVNPRDVEDIWRDHFDYFYREYGMSLSYRYGFDTGMLTNLYRRVYFPDDHSPVSCIRDGHISSRPRLIDIPK
jgi:hypothetical protein